MSNLKKKNSRPTPTKSFLIYDSFTVTLHIRINNNSLLFVPFKWSRIGKIGLPMQSMWHSAGSMVNTTFQPRIVIPRTHLYRLRELEG